MCAACSIISVLTQWGATLVIKIRERERERERESLAVKMQTVDNLFYGGVEPRASLSQPSYYAVHTSLWEYVKMGLVVCLGQRTWLNHPGGRLRNESAMSGVIRFRAGPPACGLPRSRGAAAGRPGQPASGLTRLVGLRGNRVTSRLDRADSASGYIPAYRYRAQLRRCPTPPRPATRTDE